MNEELKEIMEEAQELAHKSQKLYQKAQKMGQRSGYGGGYQRMGQMNGGYSPNNQFMGQMNGNQSMGQMGGLWWGQNPMGGMYPQEPFFDPKYM